LYSLILLLTSLYTSMVEVVKRGKKGKPDVATTVKGATIAEVRKDYAMKTNTDVHRIAMKIWADADKNDKKWKNPNKNLKDSESVEPNTKLEFKDLGAQIDYQFVFFMEYFGPWIIVLLWALRPKFLYSEEVQADLANEYHWVAKLGILCWSLHFLKREYETFFVHVFSNPTMPLSNLFKNCTYYWSFGAVVGYPLTHPSFHKWVPSDDTVYIGLAIFILSEIGNYVCHVKLRNLRPPGSKERKIPRGFLFELVSCPNYTCEVMSWVGFSIMTNIRMSWLFTLVGFLQMTEWAIKKHKNYKKDFKESYPKGRKAIVPFVL